MRAPRAERGNLAKVTGGEPDTARMLAALATIAVGLWTRSVLGATAAGAGVLYGLIAITALAAS